MLLPLILCGAALWLVTRPKASTPVVGALPARSTRIGERITFQQGARYFVRAHTPSRLSWPDVDRLERALARGTYHASQINVAVPRCEGPTRVQFAFTAPRTEVVPIGQPLNANLGPLKARLILDEIHRL